MGAIDGSISAAGIWAANRLDADYANCSVLSISGLGWLQPENSVTLDCIGVCHSGVFFSESGHRP